MEKKIRHYDLVVVKELLSQGNVTATKSAVSGAGALGMTYEEMLEIVANLTPTNFYKSMTTHNDHTLWQDVYHVTARSVDIYLKLTVQDNLLIVSFKER